MDNTNNAKWEDEIIDMKRKLFAHADSFLKFDAEANAVMLDILKLVKQNFEKNPNAFTSDPNISQLIKELRKEGGASETGFKGADITGAGPLQDIIEFIKSLSVDLIKSEKEFFMQIIKLIFCGCSSLK